MRRTQSLQCSRLPTWVYLKHIKRVCVYLRSVPWQTTGNLSWRSESCADKPQRPQRILTLSFSYFSLCKNLWTNIGIFFGDLLALSLTCRGLRRFLPDFCNCEDAAAWNAFQATEEKHGHSEHETIEDQPEEVRREVELLTSVDKLVYRAAVQRFIASMDELEASFGVRVLCESQRQTLLRQWSASLWRQDSHAWFNVDVSLDLVMRLCSVKTLARYLSMMFPRVMSRRSRRESKGFKARDSKQACCRVLSFLDHATWCLSPTQDYSMPGKNCWMMYWNVSQYQFWE